MCVTYLNAFTVATQNQQTMKMKIDNLEENGSKTRYRNRIAIVHSFPKKYILC